MQNREGDSTPPSRTPKVSGNGWLIRFAMRTMLTVRSNIANRSLQKDAPSPHSNTLSNSIGLLSDGNAVFRSINATKRRFLWLVCIAIKVRSTKTASTHPVPLRKPNCSGPGAHMALILASSTCPIHAARRQSKRIPRKLSALSAGLPGFSRELITPMAHVVG